MRTTQNNNVAANRAQSNSQETIKIKKSSSITSNGSTKVKNQMANSLNTMLYSIKKSRLDNTSKSNKKSTSQSSHNNKSFKVLTEVTSSLNVNNQKPNISSTKKI